MSKKKKEKLPITLCVITCNSEDRIKDMILKHKDIVSEVMVVVQESTDDTLARAREVADVVIPKRRKGTCDPDANWLFDLASNEWILYLGDDEYLSTGLTKKLKKLLQERVDIFWLKRKNLVDGVDIHKILGDDIQCRLFRKGAVSFPNEIHVHPTADERAVSAYLNEHIVHDRTLDLLRKSNRARKPVASKETYAMQENFISNVEQLLEEHNQ